MNVASVQRGSKERTGTAARSAPASHRVSGYWKRTHSVAYRARKEQDRDDVDHWCVTPVPWVLLARPSSVAGPSGGHRDGRRSEPVEVPQDGLDEADEGCSHAAVGPDRTRQEGLDGHAAGVLIAQIALQVRVVNARPSRVRIPGHYQIRGHHVQFRSRVRLSDVHGRSRTSQSLERLIGAPVDLLSEP